MMANSYKNSEGYADPTAYFALCNIHKEETDMAEKGQILKIETPKGSRYFLTANQKKENPGSIVGFFLLDQPGTGDYRVELDTLLGSFWMDPYYITHVRPDAVEGIATVVDAAAEVGKVDAAMADCYGIGTVVKEVVKETAVEVNVTSEATLIKVTAERDVYKNLLEKSLLAGKM